MKQDSIAALACAHACHSLNCPLYTLSLVMQTAHQLTPATVLLAFATPYWQPTLLWGGAGVLQPYVRSQMRRLKDSKQARAPAAAEDIAAKVISRLKQAALPAHVFK